MTGQQKSAETQALRQDKRMDPNHRMRIDAAIHMQGRGWMTGRAGGRPWTLSRTNRVLSFIGALMIVLLISPLLLVLAVLVKLSSPGPVFFVQQRTGYRGRSFGMYKFRTMVANAEDLKESVRHLNKHGADAIDFKIDKDPRVTRIGSFLRRSSLDELPNLFNVIRGEMRLVGPRPTSFNAYRYKDSHLARLSIYPGMTGLWQISGRSNIDFDQRVELDLSYIAEQSLSLDLKILLKTPFKVFSGHGAS
ncbi:MULTISPECIES: sugar transferase [Pseudomonas]|jgi:lipopolysaccharide/colanic/teichoic acid biosynthesis glycosyltransferase|uniref:Lipopolysaccharide/colanic/teichoic acid biosynthesis glycosyltransferase n=2 Tax=Pseudomonas TaxID=286 RepID=A0A9X8HJN2_PSEPU|nr:MULTISPECIES: sugar transferase [Pseudomonas]KIU53380.1 sugar transferase [Pseudomonas putida]KTC24980.1 sugar transferase [Pseudomonas putida]MBG8558964.1 sugar transferase [Pseudomonas qingdaonensis]MCO7504313.1 sugar transferase [Pseudomonas sp. VE 267-6A]MCO7529523.1 sugar transferase [Pseudomonas sp. 2]